MRLENGISFLRIEERGRGCREMDSSFTCLQAQMKDAHYNEHGSKLEVKIGSCWRWMWSEEKIKIF